MDAGQEILISGPEIPGQIRPQKHHTRNTTYVPISKSKKRRPRIAMDGQWPFGRPLADHARVVAAGMADTGLSPWPIVAKRSFVSCFA